MKQSVDPREPSRVLLDTRGRSAARPLAPTPRAVAAVVALVAACSSAKPEPRATEVTVASASAAPPAWSGSPDTIDLRLRERAPEGFAVDGALEEWASGDRVPGVPSRCADGARAAKEKQRPSAPTSPAATTVDVAITKAGLAIAGTLRAAAKDGVVIGVALDRPEFPPIGFLQRGGGVMEITQCETSLSGQPLSDGDRAQCEAMVDEARRFVEEKSAAFEHYVRIDEAGVTVMDLRRAPVALAGARHAAKRTGDAVAFEVALPLDALPRAVEPAYQSFELAAATLTELREPSQGIDASQGEPTVEVVVRSPMSSLPPRRWARFERREELSFAPDPGLLGQALALASSARPLSVHSYRPAAPGEIEVVRHDGTGATLTATQEALYRKEHELGPIEIGTVYVGGRALATRRDGNVLTVVPFAGELVGKVPRGDGIHFVALEAGTDEQGVLTAWFHVLGVDAEGEVAQVDVESLPPGRVTCFSAEYSEREQRFQMYCAPLDEGLLPTGPGGTRTWVWVEKDGAYRLKGRGRASGR